MSARAARSRPAGALAVALAAVVAVVAGLAACGGGPTPFVASEPPAPTSVPTVPGSTGAPTAVEVTAENLAFSPVEIEGPAGATFSLTLRNRDEGVPHNIAIRAGTPVGGVAPDGPDLFVGDIFSGLATKTYEIPALPAGRYTFYCQVHPNMVGVLTLQ